MVWQGAPDWKRLAIHAFHVRKVALYFALMLAVQVINLTAPEGQMDWKPLVVAGSLYALALGLLLGTAWFSARSTLYTLTNKRLVMRVGIVLTMTFNLPLIRLAGAALKPRGRGCGDIALRIKEPDRIAYLHLWPHARAWQLKNPQPSLRCVAHASEVSEKIVQAWRAANPGEAAVLGAQGSFAPTSGQGLSGPITA